MSELLLLTKLAPPLLPQEMVRRVQLQKKLTEGLLHENCFTRRLTMVSAPAGYGKTSLAINWLTDLNVPYAWYSLDEEDNDPKRFLVYIVKALDQVKEKDKDVGEGARPHPHLCRTNFESCWLMCLLIILPIIERSIALTQGI